MRLLVLLVLCVGIAAMAAVALHPEWVLDEHKLDVVIEPQDVLSAGAVWKVSGTWMQSGPATLADATRTYHVEFRSVPGWITPNGVELPDGRAPQPIRGVYTRQVMREETVLRLHGSNTIGANLGPELAKRYLQWLGADAVRMIDGGDPSERVVEGVFTARGETLRIEVLAHGSSTGFRDLDAGTCDVAMASRRIKDKEQAAMQRFGDMRSLDNEYVIALDGIAVIVNRGNPLTSLSTSQIAAIFAGRVTDWKEVGAGAGPIEIHARNDDSGTFDTFQSLVLGEEKLAAHAIRHESNAELSDTVAATPLAIGFCGLPYINRSRELAVRDEGLPITPSQFTVSTEDYPLSRRLYLYAPSVGRSMHTRQFLDFTLSREGQEAVGQFGFVSLDISRKGKPTTAVAAADGASISPTNASAAPVSAPVAAPAVANGTSGEDMLAGITAVDPAVMQAYRGAVRGCERLPVNFRFQFGSFDLDNKAMRDLARVAALSREAGSRHIVLVGFSDSIGDYGQNLELSKHRAQQVAGRLRELGVHVESVLGVGEEAPVASNQDAVSRERNRRVEAWMR